MSLDVCLYVDVDTGGKEKTRIELFDANITHNLGKMAMAAGIYEYLWRPEEINAIYAEDIIDALETGLKLLITEPERFMKFNSPNGWGTYKHFIPFIAKYLAACKKHPKALIEVDR